SVPAPRAYPRDPGVPRVVGGRVLRGGLAGPELPRVHADDGVAAMGRKVCRCARHAGRGARSRRAQLVDVGLGEEIEAGRAPRLPVEVMLVGTAVGRDRGREIRFQRAELAGEGGTALEAGATRPRPA